MEPVLLKYGDHDLQQILVWCPKVTSTAGDSVSKIWIIYVHGGGWRDPKVSASSFIPTLKCLLHDWQDEPNSAERIGGIASIDYRLSPHPDYPQDIDSTPSNQLRNAVHPDHIFDVRDALRLLCEKYGFGNHYLFVGHSVGATMAFWLSMKGQILASTEYSQGVESLPVPRCMIGVAGIYNIRALVNHHAHIPIYRQFVSGALGSNEEVWDRLSPALLTKLDGSWARVDQIVLAYSPDDGLVEDSQAIEMTEVFKKTDMAERCILVQLEGGHDEIWEAGTQLAVCITGALKRL